MQDDLGYSLHRIHGGRPSLARRLAEFEENDLLVNHQKSLEFFDQLKCFLPANPKRKWKGSEGFTVAEKKVLREVSPKSGYIAVSYRWEASSGEDDRSGGYVVAPNNKTVIVRDIVLDRTLSFMNYMRNKKKARSPLPIWIDQLSIDQTNSTEQAIAVQSMDLVYKYCTYAVGYLWAKIRTRRQLNLLVKLLRGQIVSDNQEPPTLASYVSSKTARDVLKLIRLIIKDSWWRSAWVFQEDYLAGLQMWLLIRCCDSIKPPDSKDTLGGLPGEIVIKSAEFKKFATLFCLAYHQRPISLDIRQSCEKVLCRAGKYNISHLYGQGHVKDQALTLHVLQDLRRRRIAKKSDLLALTANACDYDTRMDMKGYGSQHLSLSLAILALYVRNGDLICNSKDFPGDTSVNVFDFLRHRALKIDAPLGTNALTFTKHCRLSVLRLSRTGIHAKGMLWKLSNRIWRFKSHSDANSRYEEAKNTKRHWKGLTGYERDCLFRFLNFLKRQGYKYRPLVGDVEEYLSENRNLSPFKREYNDEWSSTRCKDMMAAHVINAIITGRGIRLGYLHSRSPQTYRAIFVCDKTSQADTDSWVFTSWNRTEVTASNGLQQRRLAKYVSMGVKLDGHRPDGIARLRMTKWINGLCFFEGESMSEFVFPWPEPLF